MRNLLQRGRQCQAAIEAAGGPPPQFARQYERAIAALDDAERGELGALPLVLWWAGAALAAIAVAVSGYAAVSIAPAVAEQARIGVTQFRKLAIWTLGAWAAIGLLRGMASKKTKATRRRRRR